MQRKPRYFTTDYVALARQIVVAASLLSVFVILYAVGTFVGVLHP